MDYNSDNYILLKNYKRKKNSEFMLFNKLFR